MESEKETIKNINLKNLDPELAEAIIRENGKDRQKTGRPISPEETVKDRLKKLFGVNS